MLSLPQEAQLLDRFAPAFTRPTFERFQLLCVGAIVCFGRRTVSRILWTVRFFMDGHPSSYHRLFCQARWSLWFLARVLTAAVLELTPSDQPVLLALDDTTDGPHHGKKVYAKACWRDAVRSSWKKLIHKWGQKWVVLAVLVRFPFSSRLWALPVLVALARTRELDDQERHRHKTPADLGQGLLATLLHWFPKRRFICLGDWGIGSHELAWFAVRHRRRLTLIARCRGDTNLYAMPKPRKHPRPRGARPLKWLCRKGHKLPTPQQTMKKAKCWRRRLRWYGNSQRELELFSGCGGWYRGRGGGRAALVPLRWVFTRDVQGDREDYFYSTDATISPERMVELFAGRWSIEVTFEELRAHLGLETTRMRKKESVLRTAPCLFGLFSVICLIYAKLVTNQHAPAIRQMPCYSKSEATFSDALYAVRRLLWSKVLLQHRAWKPHVAKLPNHFQSTLLQYLAEAA
jgi:hypothetical protein